MHEKLGQADCADRPKAAAMVAERKFTELGKQSVYAQYRQAQLQAEKSSIEHESLSLSPPLTDNLFSWNS